MSRLHTRELVRWLLAHGFEERSGGKTSHRQFSTTDGLKITLPGKRAQNLSDRHRGMIRRALRTAGFSEDEISEL